MDPWDTERATGAPVEQDLPTGRRGWVRSNFNDSVWVAARRPDNLRSERTGLPCGCDAGLGERADAPGLIDDGVRTGRSGVTTVSWGGALTIATRSITLVSTELLIGDITNTIYRWHKAAALCHRDAGMRGGRSVESWFV